MTTAQAESTIPTGTWQSDPIHSSVGFAVKHVVGTFRGSFGEFEATLQRRRRVRRRSPVARRCESVQVKEENLYAHLLSPEFFDAEQHPEIVFESKRIARDGDQRGRRRRADRQGQHQAGRRPRRDHRAAAPGPDGNDRLGIDLETIVDRHDYGLDWQMDLPDGGKILGDEVTLTVHLELVKRRRRT